MGQLTLRKEVVSQTLQPFESLIRVVKTPKDEILIDSTKTIKGRGVYLTPSLEAIRQARKKRLLDKGLKIRIPNHIYDQLEIEVKEHW